MKLLQQYITEILILIFLIITYSLSFFEKISDWSDNVNYIKNHFKLSPLKNYVPILLSVIVLLEIIAISYMIIGIYQLVLYGNNIYGLLGMIISAIIILFLLIGQRLAKDYVGAMSLTVYFILTIFGVYLLNR